MKFKNWLIKEEQILNEDFKTQREKFHGEFWRDK